MTTLQLPEPKVLSMPLGEALQKRRTNRDCTDAALSDDELAALLWACAGITSEDGRRTVPSTLDLRAVSAYVLRADGAGASTRKRTRSCGPPKRTCAISPRPISSNT